MEWAIRVTSMTLKDHFPIAHNYSPTYPLLLFLGNKFLILLRSYNGSCIFLLNLLNCLIWRDILCTVIYNFVPITVIDKELCCLLVLYDVCVCVCMYVCVCVCVCVCYSFVLVLILQLAVDCWVGANIHKN